MGSEHVKSLQTNEFMECDGGECYTLNPIASLRTSTSVLPGPGQSTGAEELRASKPSLLLIIGTPAPNPASKLSSLSAVRCHSSEQDESTMATYLAGMEPNPASMGAGGAS
jgi:hypothetical protein